MEEKEENLYRRKRNIMLIGITFCIVFFLSFLSGCGVNELENQAFPLVMGVEARENESFQLYLAYPDLLNENASEHALASDAYWEGTVTDLFEGMRQMSDPPVPEGLSLLNSSDVGKQQQKSGSQSFESVAAESAGVCI